MKYLMLMTLVCLSACTKGYEVQEHLVTVKSGYVCVFSNSAGASYVKMICETKTECNEYCDKLQKEVGIQH